MVETRVAHRYAQALYELATAEGLEGQLGEQLAQLEALWESIPELPKFLAHPLIAARDKEEFIKQTLADFLHPYLVNLLCLLVRKKRVLLLPEIWREFLKAAEEQGQLVYILLRVARPVPAEELDRLRERLQEVLHRRVAMVVEEAPELLAGAELVIKGRRLDASLRGRLARLAAALKG
jgi:F-type H+-transporting ATPase subunit delta